MSLGLTCYLMLWQGVWHSDGQLSPAHDRVGECMSGNSRLWCVCLFVWECAFEYLMMSMCPFLAAKWRGDVPLGSVVSPFLGSSKAAHILLDNNNCTTYTQRKHIWSSLLSSVAAVLWLKGVGSYPNSAKLAGQVQRGFPCIVYNTRVGLVLQQHLRLQIGNTHTHTEADTYERKEYEFVNEPA